MSIKKTISPAISNTTHLDASSNEMLINAVLNRSFRKLWENNANLLAKSQNVYNGMYRVLPYEPGKTYSKNSLVWFVSFYLSPKNKDAYEEEVSQTGDNPDDLEKLKDKYYTTSLYLLRSLKNNNSNFPVMELVEMIPTFDASGWKNENPSGTVYTDYFEEFTAYTLSDQLKKMHEASTTYHKFGELSSYSQLDEAVLLTDMSNIDPDRNHIYFPNETVELDSGNGIVSGTMRKWDCGLLEYDIIFKLGNSDSEISKYNVDGSLRTADEFTANYLDLENANYGGSVYSEYDNRKYYLNDSDSDIFRVAGGEDVTANDIVQHNVNPFCNSYAGKIKFPVSFIDTNYAIFQSNTPSSVYSNTDDESLLDNVNSMVFVSKSMESVVALLVIPTYGTTATKVLGHNRFRCQIVGRWKK